MVAMAGKFCASSEPTPPIKALSLSQMRKPLTAENAEKTNNGVISCNSTYSSQLNFSALSASVLSGLCG